MPLRDPLDYIDAWPDEADWFICRFNQAYVKVLEGLIVPLFYESQWQGTPAQIAEMAAKARVLWQQVITPYEAGSGVDTIDAVCLIGYIVDANTPGTTLTANTPTQIEFNTVIRDTGISATLETDGTVTLPAGTYQIKATVMISTASTADKYLYYTDGIDIIYAGGNGRDGGSAQYSVEGIVTSDGENPIEVFVFSSIAGGIGRKITTIPSCYATLEIHRIVEV